MGYCQGKFVSGENLPWQDALANPEMLIACQFQSRYFRTDFKYPQAVRRLIYTTNAIVSFNRQLRKVTKAKMAIYFAGRTPE